MKSPRWRRVSSERNSSSTGLLAELDWSEWWTDSTFAPLYLHVPHKDRDEGCIHRVYPRCQNKNVRLGMRKGILYWILP